MKKIALVFLILPVLMLAQSTQLSVYKYYLVFDQEKDTEEMDMKTINYLGMNRMDTITYQLEFTPEKANFQPVLKLNNDQFDGLNFAEIMVEAMGSYFYDFKEAKVYHLQSLNDKTYSIKSDFDKINWEFLDEEEMIYGYLCKKAIYVESETLRDGRKRQVKTTVWFSEELNHQSIPFGLTGLPGGIVKVNFNDFAEIVFSELNPSRKRFRPLKLGKIVSQEEYNQMQEDYSTAVRKQRNEGVELD